MSSWLSWSPAGLLGFTPRCGRSPACCVADFDEICETVDRVARFAGTEELIENSGRTFSYKVVPHRATWQSPRHEELYWHEGAAIPEPSFKGNADRAEDESTEEPPDKDDASAAGEASPCAESDPAVESPQIARRPNLPERGAFRSWQPPPLGLLEDSCSQISPGEGARSPHWHQAETAWQRQQEAQQKHDQVELLYAQLQELTQQKHAEEARARRHAQDVQRAKLEFEEATRKLRAAESEVWQRQEEQRREEEEERLRREEEQARCIEEEVEKRIQDKVQAELHRRLAAEERRLRDAEEDRRRQEALEAERKRILEEDVRRTYAREVEAQRREEAEGERQRQRLLRRFCQKS